MRKAASMRILLAAFAALVTVMVSCTHGEIPRSDEPETESYVFWIEGASKAPVTPYDADVRWVDILIYRATTGILDACVHQDGSGSVTVDVPKNQILHWYVLANAPSSALQGYSREEQLLAAESLLTHSTTTSLVMYDTGEITTSTPSTVNVRLDRYACKVTVNSIRVDYYDSFSTAPAVTLEKVALINVRGSIPYSGLQTALAGDLWYNKMTVQSSFPSPVGGMLVKNYGSQQVTSSSAIALNESLYCMPNTVSNGDNYQNAPSWTPRSTRVSILLNINGTDNWYPVDLPAMQVNRHYILDNFVIMGPGSNSPDIPVTRDEVSFTYSVTEWTTGDPVDVVFPE